MSGTTSATGGFIAPLDATAPAADLALAVLLQTAVAGITGLTGALVRPRWQPTPPPQPDPATDWCAVGVVRALPDANAYQQHDGAGDGTTLMQRHETLEVLASFYGPRSSGLAARLRDGLAIAQNRDTLRAAGLAFIACGEATSLPDLTNGQWINRVDLGLTFRRQITRAYPIRNLLSASGTLAAETSATPWTSET